ncbi:MAG: hypothetical protein IJR01_04450 [Bacteroidales bacterium]|nr:hypothetical protein [Bacteroidales bacterium]
MRKFLFAFFSLAAGLCLQTSCIEDEYDLDKEIDKTIELKNFTVVLDKTYKVVAKDLILPKWLIGVTGWIKGASREFTFDNGEVGTFDIDGISEELSLEYGFTHVIATMDVENSLYTGFSITANALDANKNVIEDIVATCDPAVIKPGMNEKVKVEIKSIKGEEIHLDDVRLTLYSQTEKVVLYFDSYIEVSNIVLSFPEGVVKYDID